MTLVGKSIPRKEGRKKVTGQALYVDDLKSSQLSSDLTKLLQKPLLAEKSGKAYSPAALLILLVLKIEA